MLLSIRFEKSSARASLVRLFSAASRQLLSTISNADQGLGSYLCGMIEHVVAFLQDAATSPTSDWPLRTN